MVICCINAQARQPFYRYNCLGRLLRCFFHMFSCPSSYHDELAMTYLKCYPQSWVNSLSNSHANRVFVIISTVTEQISMEYAGIRRKKCSFWSKGKMKVALESANSCDQQVFWAKSSYSINTWTYTTAYAKKGYKTCICKGIGDLYAIHSTTVCYHIRKTRLYIENSCILRESAVSMCWHSRWLWHVRKTALLISQGTL
jgi:hypothetical protein